ncbi:MAG: TlpA family protein disulfide reductase [Anaerolineae bacterium]
MAHTTTKKTGLLLLLGLVLLGAWGCAAPPLPTAAPTRPAPLPTWTPLGPTATPRPLGTRVVPDTPTPSAPSPEPTKARRVAPVVGAQAPDFVLWDLKGNEVSLGRLRGHPVVLNFWATWCPPCREEMPELAAAYEAYRERGVLFVGINFLEDADRVREYVEWMEVPFPVALDVTGEVVSSYQVRALPSTFFIDREGTVVRRYTGPLTRDLLDQYLAELLP